MMKKRFALVHARIAKNNVIGRIALISLLRIRIRDPLPFLVPESGSGVNNPDHVSDSFETIIWVKTPKLFDADPGSGMEKFGSGM
jgi:hypothetical protein